MFVFFEMAIALPDQMCYNYSNFPYYYILKSCDEAAAESFTVFRERQP